MFLPYRVIIESSRILILIIELLYITSSIHVYMNRNIQDTTLLPALCLIPNAINLYTNADFYQGLEIRKPTQEFGRCLDRLIVSKNDIQVLQAHDSFFWARNIHIFTIKVNRVRIYFESYASILLFAIRYGYH
jgi:hypothetical protein